MFKLLFWLLGGACLTFSFSDIKTILKYHVFEGDLEACLICLLQANKNQSLPNAPLLICYSSHRSFGLIASDASFQSACNCQEAKKARYYIFSFPCSSILIEYILDNNAKEIDTLILLSLSKNISLTLVIGQQSDMQTIWLFIYLFQTF